MFGIVLNCERTPLCRRSTLFSFMRDFWQHEGGIVTVEWVALAAGLTVGAIAISFIVMKGLVAPANNIASQLSP